MAEPTAVQSIAALLTDTTPLVAIVAPIVATVRRAVPAIDGQARVLGLIAAVATLILVAGFPGPWTPAAIAVQLLRVLVLTAQAFGLVTLGDRWFGAKPASTTTNIVTQTPDAPALPKA